LSACKQKSTPGAGVAAASLANTVDPICDMKLKETVKDTAHYQGKVYGFCSASCVETFKEDPAKYAK
ncbi:MAG: YHS domain-containing protein, partial [Saprospiraceae bacterium]|nr:YHS domain-containing protein [Saprospiraceae bacterium]